MRFCRVLLRGVCLLGLSLAPAGAYAGSARVVVVGTDEARGWPLAERRLIAELTNMGVDVIELPDRQAPDRDLPRYVQRYDAVAAVQIVRRGEHAIVRFWAPDVGDERGDYRHIDVNLRNTDVVSLAVLPVVEFVFERVEAMPAVEQEPQARLPAPQVGSTSKLLVTSRGPELVVRPPNYHVRSAMTYALRLGSGPWFSGASTTPAVNVIVGLRAHWFQLFSLETEGFVHSVPHRVAVVGGAGDLRFVGARAHMVYEPWPRADVALGFGPGAGVFWVLPSFPYEQAVGARSAVVSLRAQLASALMPDFDVLFMCTFNKALTRISGYALTAPNAVLLRSGVDALVAVDWHWH